MQRTSINDKEKISVISTLYIFSFALLLSLGALSMAFVDLLFGAVLFFLGLVLVAGNELMVLRQASGLVRTSTRAFSPDALRELLMFAIPSLVIPLVFAAFLHYVLNMGQEAAIIVFAGVAATAVKVLARTLALALLK